MSGDRIIRWDPAMPTSLGLGPAVLAIGVFDGLHLGHRDLLASAMSEARGSGQACLVITFDHDPDEVFRPDAKPMGKLLSNEARLEMLAALDVDSVVVLPVTGAVLSLEPRVFLDSLKMLCTPVSIHVGMDFRFGAHAGGTVADIMEWGAAYGCRCVAHPLIEAAGSPVTATRIRALLKRGQVEQARELLAGRAHNVRGTVVPGRGEGSGFGFATANLDLSDNEVMLPASGVYGGYGRVDGKIYPAAINVGRAASFANATASIEAHLIGFEGELYGHEVEVSFTHWLRGQRVFENQDELIATVLSDIGWVRENLGGGTLGSDRR